MRLPRTLSGQLVREVTLYSVLGLAAIMVVLVGRNALRYADDAFSSGATGAELATIAGCLVATLSTYAIPVAFLFGVLLATSRMAADTEITAMRACGVGLRTLLVPVLALSAAVGAATALLLVEVEPTARRELREVLKSMAARGSMIEPGTFRRFGERVFFAKRRDADRGFEGVVVSDRTDPEHSFVIFAEKGRLDLDERGGGLTLHLERGDVHVESPLGDERPNHRISFATFDVAFDAGDLFGAELTRLRPREMTQAQLRAALASSNTAPGDPLARDATAFALQLQRRAVLPFAPVLFALIGIPLGLRPVGGGRAFGAIVCALLAFTYYALLTFGGYLALEGLVAPALALWLPNAAFAAAATALLLGSRGVKA